MELIIIKGYEPHLYSSRKIEGFDRPAYVNIYNVAPGDIFEIGSGYSLHETEIDARKYFPRNFTVPNVRAVRVFVSKTTLEAITKSEDKCIFEGSEFRR